YPGGVRETTAGKILGSKPERLIEMAVRGMLPKSRLGRDLFTKLKVYRGSEHPHAAQKPQSVQV
ncbi:MAG TPA: uL13 family ribosomal protein, partial [Candidatus Nitrosotalea sp.]|nr:uL13 family ribosomal protein [Candidatus Nitrosotalea sp.]